MIRVLFVDDESHALQSLERILEPLVGVWDMSFAGGAREALERMAACPFDVIVSDAMMAGMDGAQLLTEVMNRHPNTIRIALGGHSDRNQMMELVRNSHQCLTKPCDVATLKDAVARSCALRERLENPKLKLLLTQLKSLPSLPAAYGEVMDALQSDRASMQKIGLIISRDVAMSAKILQMVNSAYFGLGIKINDVSQAIVLLGIETTKTLLLHAHVFSTLPRSLAQRFGLDAVGTHSLVAGRLARAIAGAERMERQTAEACSTAAFLHDVGKLVFATNLAEEYMELLQHASQTGVPAWQAEYDVLGCSHAEMGAYLLGIWGLSQPIVEAIAQHHQPSGCLDWRSRPSAVVYCANMLAHETANDLTPELDNDDHMDTIELLGVSGRIEGWREVCRASTDRKPATSQSGTLAA